MSNSMADKLTQIAVNTQLIYNVGYEKGKSESMPVELPHSYFISDHYVCFWGMADNCIGKPITELIDLAGALNVYGYALPAFLRGKRIKLTGFDWEKAYMGDLRENVVFVKGFTGEGGGVCAFPHSQIEITENPLDDTTTEYILDIPDDDIDGVYITCFYTGTPVVTYDATAYDRGYVDGFEDGGEDAESAYSDGFEAGKQAEYDAFWDSIQACGARTNYEYVFRDTTWDKPFDPKYSFGNVTKAHEMFKNTKVGDNLYTDKLDFSKCVQLIGTFMESNVTRLKRIDMRSCSSAYNGAASTFFGCDSLKEITEFYPPISTNFNGTFTSCDDLEIINFCSEIAVNGLNLQWSTKLSHDSLVSIINCLKDYSEDTSGTVWKVTIGGANMAKLTEADLNIIEENGWAFE